MRQCIREGCERAGNRARGLCATDWLFEQYGRCKNDCRRPANDKSGLCANCKKRGGWEPGTRYYGYEINSNTERWCSNCKEAKPLSMFNSHTHRCDHCQSAKKARAYLAKVGKLYTWQFNHILQTSLDECCKCRGPLGGKGQLDHIIPESLGGTLDNGNIQVLCSRCNQSKGNRESVDYRIFMEA